MNKRYVSINHQLYLEEDAKISITDLSIQRGFGIFDFLKTVDNRPIFLEDHFSRFYNSAKEMNIELDVDRTKLKLSIDELMEKNNLPNSGLKFILTGGFSSDGYTMSKPNLIITQTAFTVDPNSFHSGIRLVTYEHQRQLPQIKTIDYLQAIRLQSYVKENKGDDILYFNNGNILECPRANFFIINDDNIITPKTNILKGITRMKILDMKIEGYEIVEKDISLKDLETANEAFISSSTKNALPVLSIDGKIIGDGKSGKITERVNQKLMQLIQNS
ncbi:MAG: amino acid aminotransferase [Pedobacter sp.]|nr:MAG: amino acid aminotransferase [Pedobacter sp.]